MPWSFFASLRMRLILLVLLAVLPALGLTIYSGLEQREHAIAQAKMRALKLAQNASEYHKELIESAYRTLYVLSLLPQMQQMEPLSCSSTFIALLDESKGINAIAIVNSDGSILTSAPTLSRPVSVADRPYFKRFIRTSSFVIGEYQSSGISGKPSITLGYPLLDKKGRLKAGIITELDLDCLNRLIANIGLPASATISIVDRGGTVLARYPDPEQYVGKNIQEPMKDIISKGEGVTEGVGVDGVPRLYGFTSLGKTSEALYLRVGVSRDLAFAEANWHFMRNLGLLALVSILVLVISFFVGESFILRRLGTLLKVTGAVAKGNLGVRVGPSYAGGELGQLGRAFDEMAESLQLHEAELQRAHIDLEKHVRERTYELENVNALLKLEVEERRQKEEDLKKSEERYRSLVETATDIIFTISFESGAITSLNRSFEKLTGWTRDEWLGGSFTSIIHPDDLDLARAISCLVENGEFPAPYELRIRKKSGEYLALEIISSPQVEYGEIIGELAIARDLTERKRSEEKHQKLEAQLRQAQKMEAIGVLAGGIAHDFNNILGIILGFSQLATLQTSEGSKLHNYLENVVKASLRAKDLVVQILSFSRQTEQERKPVVASSIVKEALKLIRASIPATIEIRQNIASKGVIFADPTQVHQVLMNLCTNAAHAMSEKGGVLEVGLDNVEIDSAFVSRYPEMSLGSCVRLSVSDTGCGMDAAIKERIFDPYFTTKQKGDGTGLGLAVVHGIVKSYDGMVSVYSEPGVGSTFQVILPRLVGESEGATGESPSLPLGRGQTILLVDDETALLHMGEALLEQFGYKVVAKADAFEALKAFRAGPDAFDLVITDHTMPHMTGVDLAREMMRLRPDIPVILTTGFNRMITQEAVKSIGIRELLMKPVVTGDLAQIVSRVLEEAGGEARESASI